MFIKRRNEGRGKVDGREEGKRRKKDRRWDGRVSLSCGRVSAGIHTIANSLVRLRKLKSKLSTNDHCFKTYFDHDSQ